MSEDNSFSARDFESIHTEDAVQVISRPSLSYWQDAWIRLKDNRRALFSLYLIIALLAFTIAGPWLWTVDPQVQDLDQVSRAPGPAPHAAIVEPYAPWDGSTLGPHGDGSAACGTGNLPGGAADLGARSTVRARLPGLSEPVPHRPGGGLRPAPASIFFDRERDHLRRSP